MCIWSLYWKNILQNVEKIRYFFIVQICILSLHAKVSQKTDTFCAPCEKDKHILWKSPILAPKFVFFAYNTQHVSFSWSDIVSMCKGEIYVQISVSDFLVFQKPIKMYFKIKGAYAHKSQNTTLIQPSRSRYSIIHILYHQVTNVNHNSSTIHWTRQTGRLRPARLHSVVAWRWLIILAAMHWLIIVAAM
jgi:hypothetical protein